MFALRGTWPTTAWEQVTKSIIKEFGNGRLFRCRENRQHLRDFKHTKKPEAKRREEVSDSYDVDDDTDDDDNNNDDDYEPEEVESEEEGVEIVVEAKRSPAPGKKGAVRPTRPSPDVPKSDFFCQICNRGCGLQLHKFIQSPP